MIRRLLFLAACLPLFALMGCVQQVIYATVIADVVVPTGGVIDASVYAEINFTTFTQPPASGGQSADNLRMRFGNDSGDQLDLTLAPEDGSFPVGTYLVSNSGHALSFTTYSNGQPIELNLQADEGFINLNVISIVEGIVVRAEGELHLNFAEPNSGACTGTFVYSAPSSE